MKKTPPDYLTLLHEELQAEKNGTQSVTFSMYCFWTGEKELGKLDGVVSTEAGFMNGREVVQVDYDPAMIGFDELLETAQRQQCASEVYTNEAEQAKIAAEKLGTNKVGKLSKFRPDREPKYYLGKSIYQYLPMTATQAARANALIGSGQSPDALLSPRQLELLASIKQQPKQQRKSMIGADIVSNWPW